MRLICGKHPVSYNALSYPKETNTESLVGNKTSQYKIFNCTLYLGYTRVTCIQGTNRKAHTAKRSKKVDSLVHLVK